MPCVCGWIIAPDDLIRTRRALPHSAIAKCDRLNLTGKGIDMRKGLIGTLALALALSTASGAYAATATPAAAHFRTAAPQTFSKADMRKYGLNAAQTARAEALQAQGYQLKVLSPEEAKQYRAGALSTTTWIIILAAAVVVVAVAAD